MEEKVSVKTPPPRDPKPTPTKVSLPLKSVKKLSNTQSERMSKGSRRFTKGKLVFISHSSGKKKKKKRERILFQKKQGKKFTDHLKEAFFMFDENGDGTIQKQILIDMVTKLKHERKNEIVGLVNDMPLVDFQCFEFLMNKFFSVPYSPIELEGLLKEVASEIGSEIEIKKFQQAVVKASKEENFDVSVEEIDEIMMDTEGKKGFVSIEKFCKEIGGQ